MFACSYVGANESELAWQNGHRVNAKSVSKNELPRGKWETNNELKWFNGQELTAK